MPDTQPAARSFACPPGARLRIDMVHGGVAVRAITGDRCQVTAGYRGFGDRSSGDPIADGMVRVQPHADGLDIVVRARPPEAVGRLVGGGSPVVALTVQVPGSAQVAVSSVGADVTTTGLAERQSIRTVTGHVHVDMAAGDVDVTTVSGRIGIAGGRVRPIVSTTSGTVSLRAVRIDDARIESVNGDIGVTGRLNHGAGHRVGTTSGKLTLHVEGGLRVSMRSVSGAVRSDVALRREDVTGQPILIVGDGTADLRFRTVSGDLEIRGHASDTPKIPAEPVPSGMLALLQALERGEIDVDEASRRLEVSHG